MEVKTEELEIKDFVSHYLMHVSSDEWSDHEKAKDFTFECNEYEHYRSFYNNKYNVELVLSRQDVDQEIIKMKYQLYVPSNAWSVIHYYCDVKMGVERIWFWNSLNGSIRLICAIGGIVDDEDLDVLRNPNCHVEQAYPGYLQRRPYYDLGLHEVFCFRTTRNKKITISDKSFSNCNICFNRLFSQKKELRKYIQPDVNEALKAEEDQYVQDRMKSQYVQDCMKSIKESCDQIMKEWENEKIDLNKIQRCFKSSFSRIDYFLHWQPLDNTHCILQNSLFSVILPCSKEDSEKIKTLIDASGYLNIRFVSEFDTGRYVTCSHGNINHVAYGDILYFAQRIINPFYKQEELISTYTSDDYIEFFGVCFKCFQWKSLFEQFGIHQKFIFEFSDFYKEFEMLIHKEATVSYDILKGIFQRLYATSDEVLLKYKIPSVEQGTVETNIAGRKLQPEEFFQRQENPPKTEKNIKSKKSAVSNPFNRNGWKRNVNGPAPTETNISLIPVPNNQIPLVEQGTVETNIAGRKLQPEEFFEPQENPHKTEENIETSVPKKNPYKNILLVLFIVAIFVLFVSFVLPEDKTNVQTINDL
jgi:hypothetical protein